MDFCAKNKGVLGSSGAQWPQQWPPGINVGMGLVPSAAYAAPFLLSTRAGGPRANTPLDARDTLVRALSDPTALLQPAGSCVSTRVTCREIC